MSMTGIGMGGGTGYMEVDGLLAWEALRNFEGVETSGREIGMDVTQVTLAFVGNVDTIMFDSNPTSPNYQPGEQPEGDDMPAERDGNIDGGVPDTGTGDIDGDICNKSLELSPDNDGDPQQDDEPFDEHDADWGEVGTDQQQNDADAGGGWILAADDFARSETVRNR